MVKRRKGKYGKMQNNQSYKETKQEIALRERMVREQLISRGLDDPRVLQAFRSIPRSQFCPPETSLEEAYEDHAMGIGRGQTISQPYMVALMTWLLSLTGREKVLEIGTGSGYQAAILGKLAEQVHTVERIESLALEAQRVLQSLKIDNVHVHVGDGTLGWPAEAPYDAIIVTAATPEVPPPLEQQIADGGRLIAPVGDRVLQRLVVLRRHGDKIERDLHSGCAFVPLLGEHGWKK